MALESDSLERRLGSLEEEVRHGLMELRARQLKNESDIDALKVEKAVPETKGTKPEEQAEPDWHLADLRPQAEKAGKPGGNQVEAEERATAEKQAVELDPRLTMSKSRASEALLSEKALEVTFQGSVWDLTLFLGLPEMGILCSVVAGFGICLNMLIQVLICTIVITRFPLRDSYVDNAQSWRETVAHSHDYADGLGRSMASRVCGLDGSLHLSGSQLEIHTTEKEYLEYLVGSLPVGPIISGVCIFLWILCLLADVNDGLLVLRAAWHLPLDRKTSMRAVDEQLELRTISWHKRLAVSAVSFVRFGIAIMLGISGTLWLANTKSIEDILLNAVALSFVLEIDELIYKTLIPMRMKTQADSLKPLLLPASRSFHGLDAHSTGIFLTCLVVTGLCFRVVLLPEYLETISVMDRLCGGNADFVLGTHAPTDLVLAFRSNDTEAGQRVPLAQELSKALARNHDQQRQMEVHTWHEFESAVRMPLEAFVLNYGECKDFSPTSGAIRASLGWFLNRTDISTCADLDVALDCNVDHPITRFACPVTCSCGQPLSGAYIIHGCPMDKCAAEVTYSELLHTIPIEDIHMEVLRDLPAWKSYWDAYVEYYSRNPTLHSINRDPKAVQSSFRDLGCGALGTFNDQGGSHQEAVRFFCSEVEGRRRPLRPFCSQSCGCAVGDGGRNHFCPRQLPHAQTACASLEVLPRGTPTCDDWNTTVYRCIAGGYNGENTYEHRDAAGDVVWEIRKEAALDWGARFLGAEQGAARLQKWTLTSRGPDGARRWHYFTTSGPLADWLPAGRAPGSAGAPANASAPTSNATGPGNVSGAAEASGGLGACALRPMSTTQVSFYLYRKGVECETQEYIGVATSLEMCQQVCIETAGTDCNYVIYKLNMRPIVCYLARSCVLKSSDQANVYKRVGMCPDLSGAYYSSRSSQGSLLVHQSSTRCELALEVAGNLTQGIVPAGNASSGLAHGLSVSLELPVGTAVPAPPNGSFVPTDRSVMFADGERWSRMSFAEPSVSCRLENDFQPVSEQAICDVAAQELRVGSESEATSRSGRPEGCYWSSRRRAVYFSTNPANRGNGRRGFRAGVAIPYTTQRVPICQSSPADDPSTG